MQATTLSAPIKRYSQVIYKIVPCGLIVFITGFFCLPEVSWVKTNFYLLVLLPSLILLPLELKKFPFKSPYLLLFIALPLYLSLSHLWADKEAITRDFSFFIKQVVFIFILVFSLWVAQREAPKFLKILILFLVVTGIIFSFVSIAHYLYTNNGNFNQPLMGFSTNDSNKAGAFFTIHLGLCLYVLLFDLYPYKSKNAIL